MKILVMGLSGAGKTYFAETLYGCLKDDSDYFNADLIRDKYNDWDFSIEGRKRQVIRMKELCNKSDKKYIIADFICPTKELRDEFCADVIVWLDTVDRSQYEDTDQLFEKPIHYDLRISTKDSKYWVDVFLAQILEIK